MALTWPPEADCQGERLLVPVPKCSKVLLSPVEPTKDLLSSESQALWTDCGIQQRSANHSLRATCGHCLFL